MSAIDDYNYLAAKIFFLFQVLECVERLKSNSVHRKLKEDFHWQGDI